MSKCPECSAELEEEVVTELKSQRYAQANPGKGGYFGENPREYGASGFGDLYDTWHVKKIIRKCSKCGYEDKIPYDN